VIWRDVRNQFQTAPEENLKNRSVFIFGKILLYKNKPEIIIQNPNQIIEGIAGPIKKEK
jgi:hypothetical protein